MKSLLIKKFEKCPALASEVPALMDVNDIEFNPIACVNWKEYPYQPEVKFRAAHTGCYLASLSSDRGQCTCRGIGR